jgi:LCP family protein required for cell wall assembly
MTQDTTTQTDGSGAPRDERTSVRDPRGLRAHPHVRRVFLGATASLSAFVMVVAAIAMGTYFWARAEIPTIPELPPSTAGATGPVDIAGRCDERACNYLLLGSDSRKGLTEEELIAFGDDAHIGGENRSDTIILVHTRPDRREVVFVSFPRDLWVDIPGMGPGKINSAFEGGIEGDGAYRVSRTVKQITGMQIHHVLYVNLLGFQRVVDALGGVDMCVPYPMYDELTLLDIPAGCQHFDGRTALAYVRTRHQPCDTVPDFARISRQQQFLRAVIAKVLQPGELLRLQELVPELLGNLVVDEGLNPAELVYLAGLLQGVGTDNADFRALPTVPEGIYDANGTYVSVVTMVQPDADELLRRIREGRPLGDLGQELSQTAPSPANIVVAVVDRNGSAVATDVYDVLTEGGFNTSPGVVDLTRVGPPTKGSMILYRAGAEPMAKVVGTYFDNLDLVPAPPGALPKGQDLAVVVSDRYEIPPPNTDEPVECPN